MLFSADDRAQFEAIYALCQRGDAPRGLVFWMRACGRSSAFHAWSQLPRADWMLWIAKACGVTAKVIGRIENYVAEQHDARRIIDGNEFRPLLTAAQSVREQLSWDHVWSDYVRSH